MTTAEGERDQSLQDKAPKHYWSLSHSTQTNGTIKRDKKQNKTKQKAKKQTNKTKQQKNKTKQNQEQKKKQNKIKLPPHTKYINQIKDEETQTNKKEA